MPLLVSNFVHGPVWLFLLLMLAAACFGWWARGYLKGVHLD